MTLRILSIWALAFTFALLALSCKSSNLTVRANPNRNSYTVPAQTADGWQTASLAIAGLDEQLMRQLSEKIARQEYPNIHSVLVVKSGLLVYEEYFSGIDSRWGRPLGMADFDRDSLHDIRSVTKSVVSALVGIALSEDKISSVDQPIFDFFPRYAHLADDAKQRITVRHALTMTAGLDWDESSVSYRDPRNSETAMSLASDPVRYVLERNVVKEPGSAFKYNGGLTTTLAAIVKETTGSPIDTYAETVLFGLLGIENYEWLKYLNGTPISASGLRLRPRDMAKFGLLYLNNGRWRGQQVVPQNWITASVESHVDVKKNVSYGYQWWIGKFDIPGNEFLVYEASGNGGQKIYVVPSIELVAVITAGNYDVRDRDIRFVPWRILEEHLLPAAGVTFDRKSK